jgi:hypothetical protein
MAKISQQKLAVVHLMKKELRLDDAEYRRFMRETVGVSSAKDLDEGMFRRLMNAFVRSRYYRANASGMTLRQKWYIESLAKQMGWDSQHLDHFIYKFFHERDLRNMNKKEASHLIDALKNIHARYNPSVLTHH